MVSSSGVKMTTSAVCVIISANRKSTVIKSVDVVGIIPQNSQVVNRWLLDTRSLPCNKPILLNSGYAR